MREQRKLHMFLILLAAILSSVMFVMMWMGGGVNFQEFMSAGMVYDFDPAVFERSSSSWRYDSEKKGCWLLSDKAAKNYPVSSKERAWNYLYITIDDLSRKSVEGMLRYYDSENEAAAEQAITLKRGRNTIPLKGTVPLAKVRITLLDAKGEFISISDMQIRTTPSEFTASRFGMLFVPALAGSVAFLTVLILAACRLRARKRRKNKASIFFGVFDILQDAMQLPGDVLGGRMGGKLAEPQKDALRIFLFCLLFVWMVAGNVMGWIKDEEIFRYHVLISAVALCIISLVSWEKPLEKKNWDQPLMRSWFGIWFGVILCDFFIRRELESVTGYSMMFAGTVFIYFWHNMKQPDRIFDNLLRALEITFFIGVLYCIIFRIKSPEIDYNGMFKSSEELSMYAVMMAVVFLTELDWLIISFTGRNAVQKKKLPGEAVAVSCVKCLTGLAISLFFAISSAHISGITALIIIGVLYLPHMAANVKHMVLRCRKLIACLAGGGLAAIVCVHAVNFGIEYLPELLDINVQYGNELSLSDLEGKEKETFLQQNPQGLEEVTEKQEKKLPIIWRNYARRLNLFGHGGMLRVFRRAVPAFSGYLDMAYHHGIFILLPYAAYQMIFISGGAKCAFGRNVRRNVCILYLGIVYLCFSVCANVEISWGHPLWLCYYLSAGYLAGRGGKLCEAKN